MPQTFRPLVGTDLFADSFQYLNDTDLALLTEHAGGTAPAAPVAHQRWLDTAGGWIKRRNAANDAWIIEGVLGQAYQGLLPRSGGAMTGDIDMAGKLLLNLGLGSGLAAARVQELDLKAPIAAPQFTGDAQVNQDPSGNNSLVRRSWSEGRYAKLAGATFTGAIVLPGNALADLQAVPFQQLRDFVGFNLTTGHRHSGTDSRKVRATDLDSGAATSGSVLEANGSGASQWTTGVRFKMKNPPLVCARHAYNSGDFPTNALGWKTVDLSSYVASGTQTALLLCRLYADDAPQTDCQVGFRPGGASTAFADAVRFYVTAPVNSPAPPTLNSLSSPGVDYARVDSEAVIVWVGLSASKIFEWKTDIVGNNNDFGAAFWLLGEG